MRAPPNISKNRRSRHGSYVERDRFVLGGCSCTRGFRRSPSPAARDARPADDICAYSGCGVPAQRPMLRATSCAAVLLRFGLFISLPSQCPLQTARLVGEEPARHDTVWQLTVVETPVICMKPLPLNRTPSPGRVVPSSARPSYSAPLATSVGVARLMDSSPTCAQNGFTFYRCAACQPQSRVEPAARAAPRPGKARRKGNYIHQLPPWRAAVLRSAGEFCGRTPGRAARAQ